MIVNLIYVQALEEQITNMANVVPVKGTNILQGLF